jgi:transcriptional regulator with XRE-family HTH domain
MTAADFESAIVQLGISRAELCRRLGLSLNTGTAYAKGRAEIPPYIALAIAALVAGLPPYGSAPAKPSARR